jgi:hypothetical protein
MIGIIGVSILLTVLLHVGCGVLRIALAPGTISGVHSLFALWLARFGDTRRQWAAIMDIAVMAALFTVGCQSIRSVSILSKVFGIGVTAPRTWYKFTSHVTKV